MKKTLEGKKVAFLVANGFEEIELTSPWKALKDAGAQTFIVSTEPESVKSFHRKNWNLDFKVDLLIDQVKVKEFDALVLPGGVINPDILRRHPKAVKFVKDFMKSEKIVAAICHGPWMLAEADVIRDRKLTSFMSIKTDLKNAGAKWSDKQVVVDRNLITSRYPDDLEAFNFAIIKMLGSGK